MINRVDSSQLVDLHVYVIPKKAWKNRQNLVENEAIEQAISAGFVRVPQTLTISELRQYIINTCGNDNDFPSEFIYLRSVGRCLTKVKHQQETELKVKNYRPPITIAPEIFILEGHHDDNLLIPVPKQGSPFRESPLTRPLMSSQSWIIPVDGPVLSYPLFAQNNEREHSTRLNLSTSSSKLNPRDLTKLREEQERLRLRQLELARKRYEIEEKQHQNEEEHAAIKIQAAFRGYRDRHNLKHQQEADAIEFERLQNAARSFSRQKPEDRENHDVVRCSHRREELQTKRIELEANREVVVRRMQQLHTQVTVRRREEKNLWKQKYFIEKNRNAASEEQNRMPSKYQTDIHTQLEQAKIRLNNATKLRQQAEYESRLLRQELQQIRSSMNTLERHRLPKRSLSQTEPISLDITLQY